MIRLNKIYSIIYNTIVSIYVVKVVMTNLCEIMSSSTELFYCPVSVLLDNNIIIVL